MAIFPNPLEHVFLFQTVACTNLAEHLRDQAADPVLTFMTPYVSSNVCKVELYVCMTASNSRLEQRPDAYGGRVSVDSLICSLAAIFMIFPSHHDEDYDPTERSFL